MSLENELRSALRRREPPEGFAARVLARAQSPRSSMKIRAGRWLWAGAAIAATVTLVAVPAARRHRAEGALAGRRAVVALRITAEKLNGVRSRVARHRTGAAAQNAVTEN